MNSQASRTAPDDAFHALRQQAETVVRRKGQPIPVDLGDLSPEAVRKTLHELQVQQIELEMQNDELRRMHAELDAERARYFDLYDMAPVGYCTLSEQGLILEANFTAATLLGAIRSVLIGSPISRFILRADQDIHYRCRKHLRETGMPQSCELRMLKSDGTFFWAHLAASAALGAGGEQVQRVMLSDISTRIQLDQALQEKNAETESAQQAAVKANRAKSDFLLSMSHELRSPLNSILGFAQLMQAGTPPPGPTEAARIDHILQAGWFLLALINDVLDLATVESGHLHVELANVSLSDLLPEIQALLEPQAQKKGITLHLYPCGAPLRVMADPTRLKQVIINLLSNAIKYNRPGGSVEVSWRETPGPRVHFSVRDTGEGLPPEKVAQLFQPFNRLGRETSAEQGTGIGLVICHHLVELMHGRIGVESVVGAGTEFWFELPQAQDI